MTALGCISDKELAPITEMSQSDCSCRLTSLGRTPPDLQRECYDKTRRSGIAASPGQTTVHGARLDPEIQRMYLRTVQCSYTGVGGTKDDALLGSCRTQPATAIAGRHVAGRHNVLVEVPGENDERK